MSEMTLQLRLQRLEHRVEFIEQRLGLAPDRTGSGSGSAATVIAPPTPATPRTTEGAFPTPVAAPARPQPPNLPPPLPTAGAAGTRWSATPIAAARTSIGYAGPVAPAAPSRVPRGLEQTIGLKWAGWVGAVVLVIGAALGAKWGYDQGWFAQTPLSVRLGMIVASGLALLAGGEVVYRRVHRIPAASLFGAGVATLFVAAYVGHAYFRLYSQPVALGLMTAAMLIGAAVSMRGNLVSIAVLAVVGGNIAPVLLSSGEAPLMPFLCYLLALQVVAVFLAWWGATAKWWTLRSLSLATTSIWMLAVMFGRHGHETVVLTFMLTYALVYHFELIVSSARSPRPTNTVAKSPSRWGAVPGVTFALALAGALTAGVLIYSRHSGNDVRTGWLGALAVAHAALGIGLVRWREALRPLSVAHRIAATALVVVMVPVALLGARVEVGWMMLALAFAVAWVATGSPVSRAAAPVTWALAVARAASVMLATIESRQLWRADVATELLHTPIQNGLLVGLAIALAGHVIAGLIQWHRAEPSLPGAVTAHTRIGWDRAATFVSAFATGVWAGAAMAYLPPTGATFLLIVYAWMLAAAEKFGPRLSLTVQSAAVLALAAGKWVIVDTVSHRLSPGWTATQYLPVLNPVAGSGVLIVLSLLAPFAIRRRQLGGAFGRLRTPMGIAIFLMVWWIGVIEIDRAVERLAVAGALVGPAWHVKHLCWSAWLALQCGGVFAACRRLDPDALPSASWPRLLPAGITLAAIKLAIFDGVVWRALHAPTPWTVFSNVQFGAAAIVLGAVVLALVFGLPASLSAQQPALRRRCGALIVLVLFISGTIEVDRVFWLPGIRSSLLDPSRAEQVALSIFWSVFAVGTLVCGFVFRTAGLRYFGLGLLAVTLLKVVLVDLSQVHTGYRILSFLGLGILLLGTSVLYGKVSPRLLGEGGEQSAGQSGA